MASTRERGVTTPALATSASSRPNSLLDGVEQRVDAGLGADVRRPPRPRAHPRPGSGRRPRPAARVAAVADDDVPALPRPAARPVAAPMPRPAAGDHGDRPAALQSTLTDGLAPRRGQLDVVRRVGLRRLAARGRAQPGRRRCGVRPPASCGRRVWRQSPPTASSPVGPQRSWTVPRSRSRRSRPGQRTPRPGPAGRRLDRPRSCCGPRMSRGSRPSAAASSVATASRASSRARVTPHGSRTAVGENRWPPVCDVSQTCPGRWTAASWARGRPNTAQQTSRRPLVQTSSSGARLGARSGEAGPHAVLVAPGQGRESPARCNASGDSRWPLSSQAPPGRRSRWPRTARCRGRLSGCLRAERSSANRPPAPPTLARSDRPRSGSRWLSASASCPHGPGCSSATQTRAGAAEP